MKTEFLIPFELDTSAIEQKMQAEGYEEVIQRLAATLRQQVESTLPKSYGHINWDRVAWDFVSKFLDEHADEIIDTTVLLLAERVGNKKRWRDALKDVKEKMREEE